MDSYTSSMCSHFVFSKSSVYIKYYFKNAKYLPKNDHSPQIPIIYLLNALSSIKNKLIYFEK